MQTQQNNQRRETMTEYIDRVSEALRQRDYESITPRDVSAVAQWRLTNGRRVCTARLEFGEERVVVDGVSEAFAHRMQQAASVTPGLAAHIIGDRMEAG
jgi:hypothetical protein